MNAHSISDCYLTSSKSFCTGQQEFCDLITLQICCCGHICPCHQAADKIVSARQLQSQLTNFLHNDHWLRMKVGIDWWYCIPTRFQTRGPKGQRWVCLVFVHGEFNVHLILSASVVSILISSAVDPEFQPDLVKPKTIKLVVAASPLSTQN